MRPICLFVGSAYEKPSPLPRSRMILRILSILSIVGLIACPSAISGVRAQERPAPASPMQTEPATPAVPPEAPPQSAAPPADLEALLQPVAAVASEIDAAEKAVERMKEREEDLARQRADIARISAEALRAAEALRPRLADVRTQIEKLGPPPAKDAPQESAQIAAERSRLNTLASQIDGAVKTAEVAQIRAQQLSSRVQELRQGLFARQILRRTPHHPLRPVVWQQVVAEVPGAGRQIGAIAYNWWTVAASQWLAVAALVAATFAAYVGLRALRRRLINARLRGQAGVVPSFFERAATAIWVAPAFALPMTAAALLLYVGLDSLDLLYLQTARFAETTLAAVLIFVAVASLARAILQPGRSRWRLLDLSDRTARTLHQIVRGIAAIYAFDLVLKEVIRILFLPLPVSVAEAFVASIALAVLLGALVLTPFEPRDLAPGAPCSRWRPRWLKLPLIVVAIAIGGVSILGYVALGRFLAGQVVLTGSALVVTVLLHLAIRAMTAEPTGSEAVPGSMLARQLGLDQRQRHHVNQLLGVVLNVLLVLFAAPLILVTLGFPLEDALSWIRAAIFGFEIGQFRISLATILIAIGLFFALIAATRLFQRWLSNTVLSASRMDVGIANSIHTAVGYAGFAVAGLAAVSYGGLDITNLAILAGALSVGIGFGLQSIVNNFVSGLILLVERPVKVGDWIIVSGREGYVRRISVRATEIETFDRASVIVPNSELITGPVTNWTHRNALGRVVIKVKVAYSMDPERIIQILEKVAEETTSILRHPAPFVTLDELGGAGLEFSLYAYLADINRSLKAQTEMRTRIAKAFHDAEIELPVFPNVPYKLKAAVSPVKISIKVAHNADPVAVMSLLHAIAASTPGILAEPAPSVTFDEIGDTAFHFTLEAHVGAAESEPAIATRLRSVIITSFRAAGIELAHPRQDVHLRDLDAVRAVVARLAEERARGPSERQGRQRPTAEPATEDGGNESNA